MKIINALIRLLYPAKCAFCGRIIPESDLLLCKTCSKNLPLTIGDSQTQHFPHISSCASPLYYERDVRESILRYKFGGAAGYCKTYADFIAKCIDEKPISCDIITWVPLSRARLRRRGYDQAMLIAQQLSEILNVPLVSTLTKTRNTKRQSRISDAALRRKNVAGVYSCRDAALVRGKSVLICDDVVTTGATLSECGKVLSAAGAADVSACSVARKRD